MNPEFSGELNQDHAPFLVAGVPAFSLRGEPGDYVIHHHAITDMFDKVDPRLLPIDTAVMGAAACCTDRLDDDGGLTGSRVRCGRAAWMFGTISALADPAA